MDASHRKKLLALQAMDEMDRKVLLAKNALLDSLNDACPRCHKVQQPTIQLIIAVIYTSSHFPPLSACSQALSHSLPKSFNL